MSLISALSYLKPIMNNTIDWLDLPNQPRMLLSALQFQFSQTQSWPPSKLASLQLEKARDLLSHATSNTQFYKDREYPIISNLDEWQQLPILSRSDVQKHAESLHSTSDLTASHGKTYKLRTSGSTGRPIEVLTSEKAQWFWKAITIRDHLWHKRNFDEVLAVIKYMGKNKGMSPGLKSKYWGSATATLYNTAPSISLNSSVDVEEQYQWLVNNKPGYLLTYPSLLKALSEINRQSHNPLSLQHISTIGENLTPGLHQLAKESFGCKPADIYSSQEAGYIALQCPKHNHYHIQAETTIVEILNDQDQPCQPGEMGRVIITPLQNYAMPLIRYEIGDYAIPGKTCDCGINLPVIEKILGRTRNIVSYPDGKKNWPSYNPMKIMDELPNAQFQLIQKDLQSITLKVATKLTIPLGKEHKIKNIINESMGYNFSITIEKTDKISRADTGKYEEFISEIENHV
ncbi:MAG: phenylacetate--CoA ligase family protein [Cellvibrionaceae bacterium]